MIIQMTKWKIILAIIIVGLSITVPIYYLQQNKKNQKEELKKIKAYGENINEKTRNKYK